MVGNRNIKYQMEQLVDHMQGQADGNIAKC